MRNPKWHRDEIILALDLYFTLGTTQSHSSNPKIIDLSILLNKLPIFEYKPDADRFRNPNGVTLKLSNFKAIDSVEGKGMSSYSKLDKEIFFEFSNNKIELASIANAIKSAIQSSSLIKVISEDYDEMNIVVKEGQILYKLHKYRERNQLIVKKKKSLHLKKYGSISCELCNFDFEKTYGEIGRDFIECHHVTPLYQFNENSETKLEDLILVCSNCHRMLHRGMNIGKNKKGLIEIQTKKIARPKTLEQ